MALFFLPSPPQRYASSLSILIFPHTTTLMLVTASLEKKNLPRLNAKVCAMLHPRPIILAGPVGIDASVQGMSPGRPSTQSSRFPLTPSPRIEMDGRVKRGTRPQERSIKEDGLKWFGLSRNEQVY